MYSVSGSNILPYETYLEVLQTTVEESQIVIIF